MKQLAMLALVILLPKFAMAATGEKDLKPKIIPAELSTIKPQLGNGYRTDKPLVLPEKCIDLTNNIGFEGSAYSDVNFTTTVSKSNLEKSFGFQVRCAPSSCKPCLGKS